MRKLTQELGRGMVGGVVKQEERDDGEVREERRRVRGVRKPQKGKMVVC